MQALHFLTYWFTFTYNEKCKKCVFLKIFPHHPLPPLLYIRVYILYIFIYRLHFCIFLYNFYDYHTIKKCKQCIFLAFFAFICTFFHKFRVPTA